MHLTVVTVILATQNIRLDGFKVYSVRFGFTSISSSWSKFESSSISSGSILLSTTLNEMKGDEFLNRVRLVMYLQGGHGILSGIRYLRSRGGENRNLESTVFYEQVLPELLEDRFHQFFGMTREEFLYILSVIEDNTVFRNNSHLQQYNRCIS